MSRTARTALPAAVPRRRAVGRILGAPAGVASFRDTQRTARLHTILLILCLPLFAETFQYLIDILPLYVLSKAWPLLVLPLAIYAVARLPLPYKPLFACTLIYIVVISPMLSMFQLGNGFFDALATTVKTWSFMNYFSLAAFLFLLKPDTTVLRRTMVGLGIATFVIMLALWLVMPSDAYVQNQAQSKLLIYDDRGYHIYMPMFFGMFYVLYLNRRLWIDRSLRSGILLLGAGTALLIIYKERTALAAGAIALVYGFASSFRGTRRLPVLATIIVLSMGAGGLVVRHLVNQFSSSLGASLSVRQQTAGLIYDYITDSPLRWVFGVGSITRFSTTTLGDIFHDRHFFLADVGWFGTLFEYGIVGTVLIILVYVAGLRLTVRAGADGTPFSKALGDYGLYLLITSTIYSAVFTPGEIATVTALAIYLRRPDGLAEMFPEQPPAAGAAPASRQRRRAIVESQAAADRLAE